MSEMAVIVPSRGRPQNIRRLFEACRMTRTGALMTIVVDGDDDIEAYEKAIATEPDVRHSLLTVEHTNMADALNYAATLSAEQGFRFIGFLGDDHVPRSRLWDREIEKTLSTIGRRPGIAYGNDLMHGPALPTAVFMDARIVTTLGYMVPPGFTHLFLDNVWRDWGVGLGRFHYCPNIVIEHLHPQAAGEKAEWDEGYTRVNSGEMWAHDEAAYKAYKNEGHLAMDLERMMQI